MVRTPRPPLSLTEWAVLALIGEGPTHGFAVAKELAREGDLGRIWTVRRPLVYRAVAGLEDHDLVRPVGVETSDRGPNRTLLRATPGGLRAVERWLVSPAAHVRELRTELLLKFRLLDRRGRDLRPLAAAQLDVLAPTLLALRARTDSADGFDRLLASWRYESARAAARALEQVLTDEPPSPGPGPAGADTGG